MVQAEEHEIFDLKPFFTSSRFSDAHFLLDESNGWIKFPLGEAMGA